MPIIKSAKKRAKQQKVKTERNRHFKSKMTTLFKNILKWVKGGEVEKAETFFNETQKAIDTAAKKNIIHKNTADRRKSAIALAISTAKKKGHSEVVAPVKKSAAPAKKEKAPAKKKEVAKKSVATKKAPEKKAPAKKKTATKKASS